VSTQHFTHDELAQARTASPLGPLVPLLHALLGAAVREAGLVLVITDPMGRLLWTDGDPARVAALERRGLMVGTRWSGSADAPTALGRALHTRAPARDDLGLAEGRDTAPAAWSAVPVRDPRSGEVPGALGVTGGEAASDAFVLAALRGAAATLESHLATVAARAEEAVPVGPSSALALLRLTGPDAPTLDTPHGTSRLTVRHAEILTVLADAPYGLTGDGLLGEIFSRPVSTVTLRAEMSRLRGALEACGALEAGVRLSSRPYRLDGVEVDATRVGAHLARGSVSRALAEYGGPVLPTSTAPALVRLREELDAAVRTAVAASGSPEVTARFRALPAAPVSASSGTSARSAAGS